jgi:uncharacterized protein YndB with AHSA1/START domain
MENYIKAQITINAPISKVWDALINPDVTAQYMFGCRVTSDWMPGSRVDWVGEVDGKSVTFVTGRLITLDAPSTFVYSVIDPLAAYPQTPENHLIVSCHITEANGVTELAISQGDYSTVAEGEKRYGNGAVGWDQLLVAIKNLLETA